LGDQIEKNEMDWAFSMFGGEERCIQVVGTPEGKGPLGRPRGRWAINIKKDLQEVGGGARTELNWLGIGTGDGHL
jgi:hypothetical protein